MTTAIHPPAPRFQALIASAFDVGSTIAVHIRGLPEDHFVGRVVDVSAEAFALYHAGSDHGWHWAFRYEDVIAVGLRIPLPAEPPSGAYPLQRARPPEPLP